MYYLLFCNAISLAGCLLMIAIGLFKNKKTILIAQSIDCLIMGIANLLLGGFTGFMMNVFGAVRNAAAACTTLTPLFRILFILVQIIAAALGNRLGLIGWLPVISTCVYTWYLNVKDPVRLKLLILGTLSLWIVYDFMLKNYSAFAFDLMTIISNLIGIYRIRNEAGTKEKES